MGFAHGGDQYKDLWISTKSYFANKLIDMLPRSHPLLSKIAGNNNVKAKALKGKRFAEPILARTVNNVKSIRYRDQIATFYPNLLEMIEVEPKLLYQGVTVNDKELSINHSDELIDYLSIYHKGVREGFSRDFAKRLYESGIPASSGDYEGEPVAMNGIPYMISDNPYLAGLNVYNLPRGGNPGDKYEFWRNRAGEFVTLTQTTSGGSATPAQVLAAVRAAGCYSPIWPTTKEEQAKALIAAMTMMLLVLNGVSEVSALDRIEPIVDGIYMNYAFYNLFQYARYNVLHINNVADQKIDIGFVKLEHMGIPVYLDKNCPMNKIYFIDSSQIDLLYVPGENFKQEVKEIPDAFAKRYITSFMGNYIIHKARNCGVINLNNVNYANSSGTTVVVDTITSTFNSLPLHCNVCDEENYIDYDYPVANASAWTTDSIENSGYSGSGIRTGASYNPPPYKASPTSSTNIPPTWNGGNEDAPSAIASERKKAKNVEKDGDK
jgi:hypothetical protein